MRRTLGFLAVLLIGLTTTALAADATGTWTWTVERGGQTFTNTLKLKQDGEKLTGTISGRNNTEIAIENGKVSGEEVSFQVTREFNNNKFVQQYRGKVSGDTIKGQVEFENRDGEKVTRDWEAKKS
jgi:hypothetical protein